MRSLNGRRIRSFAIRAPMLQLFTAAHLQPSMQHDCSMPHDCSTLEIKAHSPLENQSTLSRILHNNNSTTLERKSKHTLENQSTLSLHTQQQLTLELSPYFVVTTRRMMVLVVMVYIIIHSHSRALSLLCHDDEEDDDVGRWR